VIEQVASRNGPQTKQTIEQIKNRFARGARMNCRDIADLLEMGDLRAETARRAASRLEQLHKLLDTNQTSRTPTMRALTEVLDLLQGRSVAA
jgi:hypothetical protein